MSESDSGNTGTFTPPLVLRPTAQPVVVMPRAINLDWPDVPVGDSVVDLTMGAGTPPAPEALLAALPGLLRDIDRWHEQGAAVLAPWSLRWTAAGISAWCAPGLGGTLDWPVALRHLSSHGPSADLYVLGMILHRLAVGRWAPSGMAAVVDAGVLGGEWPVGTDAVVLACLHPDSARRAQTAGQLLDRVERLIRADATPAVPEGSEVRVADESVTGWTKTRGRPDGDNEDAAAWAWTRDGVVAAVLDGVSGAGDGGGRWASRELRRRLRAGWARRVHDPLQALDQAVAVMGRPPRGLSPDASTVGVVVRIASGRLDWVNVGDCRLYLARPRRQGMSVTRLTPEHSVVAAALRAGRNPRPDEAGVLTSALPRPDRGRWSGSVPLGLGDVAVLVSDGACAVQSDDDNPDHWQFVAVLEDLLLEHGHVHVPLLVSQLCRRAEELGGEDNSTALAISYGPVPEWLTRPRRARSTVQADLPPLLQHPVAVRP